MRRHVPSLALLLTSLLLLDGCQVITGIFKAGVGVGVAGILFLIVAIGGIAAMVSKK